MTDLTNFETSVLRIVAETARRKGDEDHGVSTRAIALEHYGNSNSGNLGAVTRTTHRLIEKGYLKTVHVPRKPWPKNVRRLSEKGKEWARDHGIQV